MTRNDTKRNVQRHSQNIRALTAEIKALHRLAKRLAKRRAIERVRMRNLQTFLRSK